jgi:error-prone DNA polymerase
MRYAELHCKTNFSFLEGASHADELVARGRELGYSALAVTDRNSLAGVVRAHIAAKEAGLKLLIGAELHPEDGPPLVVWATDRKAYGRLSRLLTVGRRRAEKGQCRLTLSDIAQHAEGLIAGVQGSGFGVQEETWNAECGVRNANAALKTVLSTQYSVLSASSLAPSPQPLAPLRNLFPGRCYLLAELFRGPDDAAELARLVALSKETGLPLVAAGDVHYHAPARQPLHEVLTATRLGTTVDRLAEHRFANAQRHLRPVDQIAAAFAAAPEAIRRTQEIADRCSFSLDELKYEYPEELAGEGFTPSEYLVYLAWKGARKRYPSGIPPKVRELLEHELKLIEELRYEAYFLTVWDLVRFARQRGILCQGRGSAANSAVCYCLEVTSVDPARTDVLFERFVSKERNEAPDIDVDFEHERREEVLQYLYDKYGRERAGMTAVVITYRTKSAIRDVGKALGLSLDRVDALAKQVEGRELDRAAKIPAKEDKHEDPQGSGFGVQGSGVGVGCMSAAKCTEVGSQKSEVGGQRSEIAAAAPRPNPKVHRFSASILPGPWTLDLGPWTDSPAAQMLARRASEVGIDPLSPLGRRLVHLVCELVGFPRHLSQHVGGMVMTQGPLCELAPIENAAMPGRTVIQWDKDDLDELGILKVDCLCLGMLTAIRKCFDLIGNGEREASASRWGGPAREMESYRGAYAPRSPKLTLANVPPEDPRVYDMICRADTIGVFQIESRAQMSMLPRLKPRCYYDLVIEVAIVRPGPIQGNMVHPYLRRRSGEPVPDYPTPEIAAVLNKTLGVPLFQEQAMRLAVVAAGFTPGEADQLRRAMGAWRRPGIIDQFRKKLIDGMLGRGLSREFAEQVFNQIRGFGEYGFPESHAASFALLVYVSAWLKCYYPAAFAASLINSQPMGFYAPSQLIRDARAHGVRVLPVDVNASGWDCRLENVGCMSAAKCTGEEGRRSEVGGRRSEVRGRRSEVRGQGSGFRVQDAAVPGTEYSVLSTQYPCSTSDPPTPDPRPPTSDLRSPTSAPALRLGLRLIGGLPQAAAQKIEAARRDGPFRSLDEFVRRTGLSQAIVSRLAEADVFGSLAIDRRAALWQALGQEKRVRSMPLLAGLDDDEPAAVLPPLTMSEQVFADYRTSGLSLKGHPVGFFREQLTAIRVTPASELDGVHDGRHVRVAGIVLIRQRPGTARGITFVTLEDETGVANLVIKPPIWDRYYQIARRSPAWIAHGCLENREGVIHLVVSRLEDLSARLGELRVKSRDFH